MDHQLPGGPTLRARGFPSLLVPVSCRRLYGNRDTVSEAALHLDSCDTHMPGVPSCEGSSNRGLRRDGAVFPSSDLTCLSVVVGSVRDKYYEIDNKAHRHENIFAILSTNDIIVPDSSSANFYELNLFV